MAIVLSGGLMRLKYPETLQLIAAQKRGLAFNWWRHHIDAVVNAITYIDIKPPRLTKQGFVVEGAAAIAVAGGVVLRIRLRFHNHALQQLA